MGGHLSKLSRGGIIMVKQLYRCTSCNEVSSAEQIDNTTLEQCCHNRADRRKYVPIEKAHNNDKWYKCPQCGVNIRRKGWTKI